MKCPFFGSLFALFYIGVKWRGEAVGDKLKLVLSGTLGISWSREIHNEVTECCLRPLSLTPERDVLLGNVGKALAELF